MGLQGLIQRILRIGQAEGRPATSFFGADAARKLADKSKKDEYDREVEWNKGTPRGM